MPAEHWRPTGLSQGYYCMRCGMPANMVGTNHGPGKCQPDPDLVERLNELNTVEAEDKRRFLGKLKHGK
jgi:hypothetical protein